MRYLFRKLVRKDIQAIAEIASYMPVHFQNILEYAESLIDDPKCYYFGMFQEKKLLGVGNLRHKTSKFVWIESVRVAPSNQQKGIGTALFKHCVEKAKEENYTIVAYATDVNNYGSCNIGKKLGFYLVEEMNLYWIKPKNLNLDQDYVINQQPITLDKAFELMKIIPDGPKEEVSMGWTYSPLDKTFLAKQTDIEFYALEKTLLLEYKDRNLKTNEIRAIRAVVFGSEIHVKELLNEFIIRNIMHEYLHCVVSEKFEHIPQELGFEQSITSTGSPNKILYWKLELL